MKPETAKFAALPLEKFIFKITGWAEDEVASLTQIVSGFEFYHTLTIAMTNPR